MFFYQILQALVFFSKFADDMNIPEDFKIYTRELMGEDLFNILMDGLQSDTPVSIRLNPWKYDTSHIQIIDEKSPVPWCKDAWYLKNRPNFTFDPLLHAGLYYVQEASSMFLDHVLRQLVKKPIAMLDLCAAPGGKTTCAMSALPKGSTLFCNEPMKTRSQILNENIQKYGNPNITVTNNFPRDYKKSKLQFDVILTDVPCSGEGMFRKDEGAINEWSLQNVEKCWKLQREIISDIWECLKPGGILIYSTCTFNAHEDEENVNWIVNELGADFIDIPVRKEWNITGSLIDDNPVYRFIPGKTSGEGLFMAVLRKHGNYEYHYQHKDYEGTFRGLHVLSHGIKEDTIKGKNRIPDQSKALSILSDKDIYPMVNIDWLQAINYLRKEAIVLPEDTPKGIVLITYQNIPIGFAKNIGNRANNLYPQEWKIKSSHLPEVPTEVIKLI